MTQNELSPFNGAVEVTFYCKILRAASRHFKKSDLTIPEHEVLRRCAALMEAILTGKVVVEKP